MDTELDLSIPDTPIGYLKKYLTFGLGEEFYALQVDLVSEIVKHQPVTPVPNTPEFILGVINLRGKVVPLVDMRLFVGVGQSTFDERTCDVIVEVQSDDDEEKSLLGLVIDRIDAVCTVSSETIEEDPSHNPNQDTSLFCGIVKIDNHVHGIIDINKGLAQLTQSIA